MDLGGTGGSGIRNWNLLRTGWCGSRWHRGSGTPELEPFKNRIGVDLGGTGGSGTPELEPFKNRMGVDLGHTRGSGIETGTF
jgi:hypothetical protein